MFYSIRKLIGLSATGAALSQAMNYCCPEYQPYNFMEMVQARKMYDVPSNLNLSYKHQLFPVVNIQDVSHDVRIISFGLGENQEFQLKAAQTLQCSIWDYDRNTRITRNYTPISPNGTKGRFDVMIKRYSNGFMSPKVHDLKIGDAFHWAMIPPSFVYKRNSWETMYMIAGGVGITPMLQLIRTVFQDPQDKTKIKLLFLNRAERDILLKDELDGFAQKYPDRFTVAYSIDKQIDGWKGEVGRINTEMIVRTLTGSPKPREYMLVCGPDGLMNFVAGCAPCVMMYWSGKQKTQPTFQGANNLGPVQGLLGEMGWTSDNCWRF